MFEDRFGCIKGSRTYFLRFTHFLYIYAVQSPGNLKGNKFEFYCASERNKN